MIKALIGNGGHAREVTAQMGIKLVRFVDDQYMDNDTLPLSELDIEKYEVMVAIADSKDRYETTQRLPNGTKFFRQKRRKKYAQRNVLCGKLKAKLSDKRGNKLKLNKHGKSKNKNGRILKTTEKHTKTKIKV